MNEIISVKPPVKRRQYSKAFKARIVEACDQPGSSVAGVALANGLNANLVHRWRRSVKFKETTVAVQQPDFLPVPLSIAVSDTATSVSIEVNGMKVHWPLSHINESIAWLRALQA